ncbi:4'-phosphopantetheinyl transferase superfamily protein [Streptomyces sp. NPDC086554]|uniref:4'-phosphopantetheinyl transferase family protein n=1 Tax=Streptomyces sp. NPDC086554 TaxID=3154864 RepID=UPI003445A15E
MGTEPLPPSPFGAGEVHVRLLWIPGSEAAAMAMAAEVLDPAEHRRAAAFQDPPARRRYITAHVGLRVLLGSLVGLAPERISFVRERCGMPKCTEIHGRPAVEGHAKVHFSHSRAGDMALYAVAGAPVGVDVETREAAPSLTDGSAATSRWLAKLHQDERRILTALPSAQRTDAFMSCWVRKEAYFKGIGTGLAAGLDSRYVGFAGDAVRPVEAAPPPPEGWHLVDVPVPAGYRASVALRRTGGTAERAEVGCRRFSLRQGEGG